MEINKPITSIIFLIIILILVFLFVMPKFQESVDLQETLIQKQGEYDSKSTYYLKILNTLKNIEDRKDALGKISSALPSGFSSASLLYFLQKNASDTGLTIGAITFSQVSPEVYQPTSVAPGKEIKNVMFALNLSGSYQGLKNFLYLMEKSSRIFEVNTISFTSSGASQATTQFQNQSETHDFKLEVKTYTY